MNEIRLKIASWLLRRFDYFIFAHIEEDEEQKGYVLYDYSEHLPKIAKSCMENVDECREFILESAKEYLKRYEVDSRNFIRDIQ